MSGQVFLGAADYSVGEREPFVTVTIKRSGDLSGTATVTYATNPNTGTEGADYADTDGSVSFAAGQSSVTINVPIFNDGLSEATERFNFSLVSTDPATTILFPRTATVSILDDENPVTDPAQPPLTSPYTVTTTTVLAGLNDPIAMEYLAGTNKAFLAEKGGTIKFVDMSNGTVQSTVLDIRDKVNANADRGLMDIALHPDLANNPYLYAFYVVDPAGTASGTGGAARDAEGNRYAYLSRFTLDLSGANPTVVAGSETVIMGGLGQSLADISGNGALNFTDQAYASNRASNVDANGNYKQNYIKVDSQSHAGGAIAFGPDGKLYVSTGDGSSFDYADPRTANVQDIKSLNGKILRVDPITGAGLSDNPFATANLNANESKVWQSGLRNPYSMTFTDDGRLLISETGWYSWEEIDTGAKGANFGWPYYEGGDNGTLLKTPAYQNTQAAIDFYAKVASGQITVTQAYRAFGHANADPGYQFSAIVGASTVYTGDKYPAAFQNDYFFTDIVDGEIYAVDVNDRTKTQFVVDVGAYGPANFVQGPDGYMYLMDLVNGRILRLNITDPNAGQNHAPAVAAPIADQAATAGTAFSYVLPAGTFSDSDGDALALVARQANGTALPSWLIFNAATGTFTGTPPAGTTGTVTVRVTATDPGALAASDDFVITIGNGSASETIVNDVAAQNQTVTGATANDVFRFTGASTLYDWGPTADGTGIVIWTRSTTDNTYDVLVGFEKLRFSDKTVDLVPQNGPDYVDVPDINQQLTGKTTADRFIVNGASTLYDWGPTSDGTGTVVWTRSTTDNTYDILKGFEQIVFTDRTVTLSGTPPANAAPVVANPIADQSATIGTSFGFTVPATTFTDPDGDVLTRTATLTGGGTLPSWLTFNAATGAFSGTPPAGSAGQLAINVTANDGNAHSVTDTFILTIAGATPANQAPVVAAPIADQVTAEEALFSFTLPGGVFTDPNGDTLTRTATLASGAALPSWLSFNAATGTFTGTPDDPQVGTIAITVTARDPGGLAVADTFNLTIAAVNDAPRLNAAIADQAATQSAAFSFALPATTFTDVDNAALTLSATLAGGAALPSWLTFNPATGTFTGTPGAGNLGATDITVTATDAGGKSASDTFRLNVAATATEKLYQNAAGTQTFTGDTANDVFVVGAASTGYQWGPTQDGNGTVIWNGSGYDILVGFEQIRFTNKSVNIAPSTSTTVRDEPDVIQHLTGKSTNDIFAIAGNAADYQWGRTASGTGIVVWTVSPTDNTYDILTGFEKIQFADQTVDVSGLVA